MSNGPCWLGVMGTRGKWISKVSGLWDSNKAQAASWISRELIVRFSSISFTLKTTESGPKSKNYSVPLLKTVNCIVLIVKERVFSWRKVWKKKRKQIYVVIKQPIGAWQYYSVYGNNFAFSGAGLLIASSAFVVESFDWLMHCCMRGESFSFLVIQLCLFL